MKKIRSHFPALLKFSIQVNQGVFNLTTHKIIFLLNTSPVYMCLISFIPDEYGIFRYQRTNIEM